MNIANIIRKIELPKSHEQYIKHHVKNTSLENIETIYARTIDEKGQPKVGMDLIMYALQEAYQQKLSNYKSIAKDIINNNKQQEKDANEMIIVWRKKNPDAAFNADDRKEVTHLLQNYLQTG